MKSPRKDFSEVDELIELSIEGAISPEQTQLLNDWIVNDSAIRRHYCEYIYLTVCIERMSVKIPATDLQENNMVFDQELWNKLAQEEKEAPVVEAAAPEEPKILIEKVQSQKVVRKISKGSLFTMFAVAAAILLIFVFARFVPPATGFKVAVLSDSINAKWADMDSAMEQGAPIFTSRGKLLLREGYAKLLFDNQTQVVLEGPAEFQILTEDRIGLRYGKIYAIVPQAAIGFSVYTPNAGVIDLGTEFGIEADCHGDTVLHVIKGKTTLIAGEKSNKVSMEVDQGVAKKVSALTSTISDIPCNPRKFARSINSSSQVVWRGENISLASIVAGHDGFQKIDSLIGLNPVNGKYTTSVIQKDRNSNGRYNLVTDSDFIDGVFVPDGQSGPIRITSLGHTFDCPDTSGIFTHEIAVYKGPIENQHTTIPPVIINGQEVVNDPILMLHSNTGITFDLQAIRKSLPQLDLKSLKATGVPMKEFNPDIDFWVLVDGRIKYEKKIVTTADRDPISLNIELGPQDRFLTLIVTDGLRATDVERKDPFSCDFFYLIAPQLCLIERPQRP